MSIREYSDSELKQQLQSIDYGVCNPIKARIADEDENEIITELRNRGYSNQDIRRISSGDDDD